MEDKYFSNINQPNIPRLLKLVPNKFMLAIGTAKRAKQLKEGVKPMVKVESDGADYPIDVALKELEAGKVRITVKDKPQDETVVLDEMDQILDKEIAAATHDQEADKKTAVKEKNKPKSKSLAA